MNRAVLSLPNDHAFQDDHRKMGAVYMHCRLVVLSGRICVLHMYARFQGAPGPARAQRRSLARHRNLNRQNISNIGCTHLLVGPTTSTCVQGPHMLR